MQPDDLTEAELRLYQAVSHGSFVDLADASDRTVRASILTLLLLEPPELWGVPGVRVRGARVTGRLELRGATLDYPLVIADSEFEEPPQLMESTTKTLRFVRCRMPGLGLARLRLDGVLSLKGSTVTGPVRLDHAQINGELQLSGATLGTDPTGEALTGEGLRVTGRAHFDDGFTSAGTVRLTHSRFGSSLGFSHATISSEGQWGALMLDNAQIDGGLTLHASTLSNPGQVALSAGGLRLSGSAWLNRGFTATGEVRFIGASLNAHLTLDDSRLEDSSLNLEAAVLSGVRARGLVVERGEIRLVNARLTGDINLPDVTLTAGPGGRTLLGDGLEAVNVFLPRLRSTGRVSLDEARITGGLDLNRAHLDHAEQALSATGLTAGSVHAREIRATGPVAFDDARLTRELDLTGAELAADGTGLSLSADGLSAGGLDASRLAAAGRVSLRGAQIEGDVTLTEARIGADAEGRALSAEGLSAVHLHADDAVFQGRLSVRRALVAGDLRLVGTRITDGFDGVALLGNDLDAGQALLDGLRTEGRVALRGARITADLSAEDAVLVAGPDGRALSAEGLSAVNVRLARLRSTGRVSLRGAQVSGVIELTGAELTSTDAEPALLASWLTAGGLLLNRLTATGRVVLRGSQVSGQTHLDQARLGGDGEFSLVADGLSTRTLRMRDALLEGEANLRGVRILDQFLVWSTRFANPGGVALRLSLAEVVGNVFFYSASFEGTLRVADATIGRTLQLRGTTLDSFEAKGLQAGHLVLEPSEVRGSVQLSHAKLGILQDDPGSWAREIELDGLVYDTLEPRLDPEERLDWLRRDPRGFHPQPYEQLAAHYTALGQQRHAQTVLLARERRQGRTAPWAGRAWGRLQDVTVGYGYQPMRAAAWLVLLVAIGTLVFSASPPAPLKKDESPHFNAVMYTVDLLLPIVDLGQERAFNPEGFDQWFSYLLVAGGWILATTIAAGAARTISRR